MNEPSASSSRLGLRSFRAKFVLVVGGAVLFDLLVTGGLALWNVQRLSRDAATEVGQGLQKANQDYMRSYAESTAARVNLLLGQVHTDVGTLAGVLQSQIDRPVRKFQVGEALARGAPGSVTVVYDEKGGWAQNLPGPPSVVSVWGYLLGPTVVRCRKSRPRSRTARCSTWWRRACSKAVAPSCRCTTSAPRNGLSSGPLPILIRRRPSTVFIPAITRRNSGRSSFPASTNPGSAGRRSLRPVPNDVTQTAPYTDAITGKLIVSFFQPLWSRDRKAVAGAAGADITLDQLAEVVQNVKVAESGFGFLAMSDGNVLAINPAGEKTIGLQTSSDTSTQGVTGADRSLRKSAQVAIAQLPLGHDGVIQRVMLDEAGEKVPYLVLLKQLQPENFWMSGPVRKETMSLGIVVPEREIYASLFAAQAGISQATNRILAYQILALLASLLFVTAAVFGISKRVTAGISALAGAAKRIQAKDYSVRVPISTRDEVGEAGTAFNRMAEEISFHTENLEHLVEERTKQIEEANQQISALNTQLRSENLRLGAELAVARQIQMMVLPKAGELDEIANLEIAAYMRPADEVGGDYYDVLRDGKRLKIGIGDVTGHGLESGVLMLMVQSVARALQEAGDMDPNQFLNRLNRAIYKNIVRTNTDKHLSLAFLDYDGGRLTLSGQHEELIVVRNAQEVERIDTMDLGLPIGLEPDISRFVATREVAFAQGDMIILHTDGVTEAENAAGELFGMQRLCDSARQFYGRSAEEAKSGILKDLMAHIGKQKIHDDITLVVMRHR